MLLFHSEVDTVLSFISHFRDSNDKLMISRYSIAVFFASLFYQRLRLFHIYFICYDHLLRIWLIANKYIWFYHLPFSWLQSDNPYTFVVITHNPPIHKGQTLYRHIVIQVLYYHSIFTLNWIKCSFNRKLISSLYEQFETETVVERELTLSEEVLAEKYKDRLESSYRVIHLLGFNK